MAALSPSGFDPHRSRWIPWAFAGAFVVVIAVNVLLAVEASRSWTGVVTETPYDTGNDYNRVIAETARETALGWKVAADATGATDGKTRIVITVDAIGHDAAQLDVRATLTRPIGMKAPVPLRLAPVVPGRFEATIKLPESGNWDLHLVIHDNTDTLRTTRRLFVP